MTAFGRNLVFLPILVVIFLEGPVEAQRQGASATDPRLKVSFAAAFEPTLDVYDFEVRFENHGLPRLYLPRDRDEWRFFVDGVERPAPRHMSTYILRKGIIGFGHTTLGWWWPEEKVRSELGSGSHVLQFRVGAAESNPLSVHVLQEGCVVVCPRHIVPADRNVRGAAPDPTWFARTFPVQVGGGFRFSVGPKGARFESRAQKPGDARPPEPRWPLHLAAWQGDEAAVRELVAEGADPGEADGQGETPLLYALARGRSDVARMLLALGAGADATGEDGWTALHQAALNGDPAMVADLIAAGAAVTARDAKGRSPLRIAVRWGGPGMAALLLDSGAEHDVFTAAGLDDVEFLERLLPTDPVQAGAKEQRYQTTPLHWAAETGRVEAAGVLVSGGALPDASSAEGWTPLHLAARRGQTGMVQMLLGAGADPDARDERQRTPLYMATDWGRFDAVKALLDGGAEVDPVENISGETPAFRAACKGDEALLELLLAHGADSTVTDRDGYTPLHMAALGGRADTIRYLLSAGWDVEARNARGRTPLHCAASEGRSAAVRALVELGADPAARDLWGDTPQDDARSGGWPQVAEFLARAEENE